ncbi:hypothetical protein ANANG_G00111560 [Anguilla anguilla]|uniref:Vitellogenin domain-containing protein n=1 Tax=Anguilla anguilla TaxID=7936 RepID=A0A9D3MIP2_ANGAN|nr:hypothetical protein ANANG_G00111560 [Anguilla anguilla]
MTPKMGGGPDWPADSCTNSAIPRRCCWTGRGAGGGLGGGSAGYRISSAVDISLAWRNPGSKDDQLLRVAISDVKIENATPRPDEDNIFLDTPTQRILGTANLEALERPFLVHLKLGKVKGLYSYQKELTAIRNLKRGVASLLQLQLTSGKTQEVDASGRCMVEYTAGKDHVTRVKAVDTCKTLETGFTTHSQVLGVSGKSSSITEFTLEDGFVKTAVSEETHVLSVNARHSAAAKVVSRQTLTLVSKEAGPQEAAGQDVPSVVQSLDGEFVSVSVLPERVKTKCKTCPTLWEHWQAVHKQLEPEGLSKAAATRNFLSLIHSVRKSTKEDILKVMKNCSKTALPQMVDVVTSAQTPPLWTPTCGRKIGSTEIRESVMIIMGALVRKLCQKGGCELPAVLEVKKLLLEGPGSSEEEEKVQMYLLALKNAMLPEAVPLLTQFSESEVGALSTIAITALQRYDRALITDEVKQTLNRVYHQNRRIYEKNVRAAAADVIFSSDPSYMEVKNLLLSIGDLPHEMNKYMLSKVHDILRFEMPASAMVRRVMKDMISHNYDRFSKVGSSSAYSGFMARAEDVTSTYSLDILYSGSGILRRSNMNIHAVSQGAHLHGLQVAIEAQGLESLIGATADEGEEDLESFAGMSAVLFDVQLRPVTFFKGYSDLMSKMFSLSSDPMNVVKGLILLTDHSQVIRLQSGLKASVEFQGGLAIDISGGMEFSLWYRESKTSVNNRGALVVVGSVAVDMDLMRAAVEVSFETEASLDFITTVQFSEYPFLVCMQMDKATFPLREFVVKQESLWTGKTFASRRGRKELVPGSEFPLHQENSNMCKRVFDESW